MYVRISLWPTKDRDRQAWREKMSITPQIRLEAAPHATEIPWDCLENPDSEAKLKS